MKRFTFRILCAVFIAISLTVFSVVYAYAEKPVFTGNGAKLSGWPVEMYPIHAFRVDIDPEYAEDGKLIEMDFQMLTMPRNLLNVMIWDGWHATYGAFELDGAESSIHVLIAGSELKGFSQLDHLYVILLGSVYGER